MLRLSLLLTIGISIWLVAQTSGQTTTAAMLCSPGRFRATSGCTLCPAGSFCTGYTRTATPCPVGTSNNATGASECARCANGTYTTVAGSRSCIVCPAGSFCPNTTRAGSLCPIGTSTNNRTGSTVCSPCPSGLVATTPGRAACTMCPDGTFCPNATHSIACPRGFASRATLNSTRDTLTCVMCEPGTHASITGQRVCNKCPNGSYCADPSLTPIPCPRGTSSMVNNTNYRYMQTNNFYYYVYYDQWSDKIYAGNRNYALGERCYPCPIGYYSDTTGSVLCKKCPNGFMCPDKSILPIACPRGYYSDNTTASPDTWPQIGDTCLRCPPGTYTNRTASTSCLPCPEGMVCQDPALMPTLSPSAFIAYNNQHWIGNEIFVITNYRRCNMGEYIERIDNMTQCKQCEPGFFCPDPSQPPQVCPPGFVSNNWGATNCEGCQPGTYSVDGKICQQCPEGHYCADPTQNPVPCPRGMYSPSVGQSRCYSCGNGWGYTPFIGSTQCYSCPYECCCNDPSQDPVCPYPWVPPTTYSTSWTNAPWTSYNPNNTWYPNWNDTTSYPYWSSQYPNWNDTTRYPSWNGTTGYPNWSSQYPSWNGTTWYPNWNGTTGYPSWNGTTGYPYWSTQYPSWNGTTGYPYWSTQYPSWNGTTGYPYWSTQYPNWNGTTGYQYWSTQYPNWNGTTWYPQMNGTTWNPPMNGSTGYPYTTIFPSMNSTFIPSGR